jgi:formylglycine-generating enzyme
MSPISIPTTPRLSNSLGMSLVRIEPGTFLMGAEDAPLPSELSEDRPHRVNGDYDESPTHPVTISQPFYVGACEVTNAQYEQFAPEHKALRGKLGFSVEDDEAVVFVSWHEAAAFCRWLSEKEGLPYRLPTEAEWEYVCRAGTRSPFCFGDTLPEVFHKNVQESWFPDGVRSDGEAEVIPLAVGKTPENPWGVYDMHGNVEEWCGDWYGPYGDGPQTDPVGRAEGQYRVARGGSHSTLLYYLRSSNRSGCLPDDRSWVIGFRVVLGEMPSTPPLPAVPPKTWQIDVSPDESASPASRSSGHGAHPSAPSLPSSPAAFFAVPREFVHVDPDATGPLFGNHNHDTALAACANGDLLALWYSCVTERGRELVVAASRLRHGQDRWDNADFFWGAPDRNNHAPALWTDADGTLYHFNGLGAAATWGALATVLRTSTDHGASWSDARLIVPEHSPRHMPVQTVFRTQDGAILLPCDAVTGGNGGTATWLSYDNGVTWKDPGGTIAGIHAGVIQLRDGRLMAFGRGDNIDGQMPRSISPDMGKTWTYEPSLFPPLHGGQRCVMLRLKEGPILFVSFLGSRKGDEMHDLVDASGASRPVTGLFAALSLDEGETWPCRRLISDDGPGTELKSMDSIPFTMGFSTAEPGGYISVCQSADNLIHLISSRQHYTFNLEWLKTPPPAQPTTD